MALYFYRILHKHPNYSPLCVENDGQPPCERQQRRVPDEKYAFLKKTGAQSVLEESAGNPAERVRKLEVNAAKAAGAGCSLSTPFNMIGVPCNAVYVCGAGWIASRFSTINRCAEIS